MSLHPLRPVLPRRPEECAVLERRVVMPDPDSASLVRKPVEAPLRAGPERPRKPEAKRELIGRAASAGRDGGIGS